MTTWNPSDKSGDLTLSGGDLVATLPAPLSTGNTAAAVRATTAAAAGRAFEAQWTALGAGAPYPPAIGVMLSSGSLTQTNSGTNAISYQRNGLIKGPVGDILTGTTYFMETITVYVDASTVKFYKNGTLVYSYPNPFTLSDLYPAVWLETSSDANDQITGAFTALSYLPSGATAWGDRVVAVDQAPPALSQAATATGGPPGIAVAQTLPGLMQAATVLSGSGSAVNTKWNETDKSPAVTLSGGGLVATNTSTVGAAVSGMVRATIGSLAGNSDDWYLEITPNAVAGAGSDVTSFGIGLSTTGQDLSTGFDGSNGLGYYANGWFVGPGFSASLGPTYGVGDVIGIRKTSSGVTVTKNGTLVRTQTVLPAGILFPSAILFTSGDQATADFGATTFASLPSGAAPWFLDPATLPARNITVNQTLPLLLQIATLSKIDPEPAAPIVGTGGFFPNTIAAVLQGRTVRCDFLVRFDFLSGTMRMWQGFGTLRTNDGFDWQGIGQLGQISDLESAIGGNAPQAKFTLSGVDQQLIAEALDQTNEVYGQDCNIYLQFFDADFNCLDNPYVVWAGIMDQMRVRQSGPGECQVDLTAETIFARRALPPLGTLTDREQQRFFPGDNGLTFIPSLMSKTAIWPVILPQS